MLDNVSKTRLHSYLSSPVTATTTVSGPTGIEIALAANTTYRIEGLFANTANGDGMRHQLIHIGSAAPTGTVIWEDHVTLGTWETKPIGGTPFGVSTTDGLISVSGIIRTGPPVKLLVYYSKITDVGDDSPLLSGSYLVATQLS